MMDVSVHMLKHFCCIEALAANTLNHLFQPNHDTKNSAKRDSGPSTNINPAPLGVLAATAIVPAVAIGEDASDFCISQHHAMDSYRPETGSGVGEESYPTDLSF